MRKFLLILTALTSGAAIGYGQKHIVNGYVTNSDGKPIPSATVRNIIGNIFTLTDEDGKFKISATDNETLSISSVGYNTQEVDIKGRSNINILLVQNS